MKCYKIYSEYKGPVVQGPINANPRLNFNPGFFFFGSKAFSISRLLLAFSIIKQIKGDVKSQR